MQEILRTKAVWGAMDTMGGLDLKHACKVDLAGSVSTKPAGPSLSSHMIIHAALPRPSCLQAMCLCA